MIYFWLAVFALLALALAILLLPLLRAAHGAGDETRRQQNIRIAQEKKQQLEAQLAEGDIDQAGFDAAYLDLQNALALELESDEVHGLEARGKWMALLVVLAIPLASIALYLSFGEYRVIGDPQLASAPAPHQNVAAPQMSLQEMEDVIKERLRENPDDAEGWFMLGRTYMIKQDYARAVTAYQRSNDLVPDEPGIVFALADALAMRNEGKLEGEPERLVERGLELAPSFPNGLWLAGIAAEQRGDYRKAHAYWTRLLPLISGNPESTNEIRALIAMLEQREPALAVSGAEAAEAAEAGLTLHVDISDELRARAAADTAVFVYAKAMQGPPMPLAVKKVSLADLPVRISLSDADAMMPALTLSSFERVVVGARVSFSGNPVAQSGDFFTEIESIDSAASQPVSLFIDKVR